MKTLDEIGVCEFAHKCASSGYGDDSECRDDYEECKKYKRFKKYEVSKYIERIK